MKTPGPGTGRSLLIGLVTSAVALVVAPLALPDADAGDASDASESGCVAEVARSSGQPAFPDAQGFGRYAQGGRGGRVYHVTTLADDGPGSLRSCAEASGARTCVFDVSGTIAVDTWISVQQPYLTIAGQTSPGGIALRLGGSTNTPLLVQTHDVVIRYLRLRPGPARTPSENVDTLQISGGAHDVIVDHLSTSWPTDEGINIVGDGKRKRPCQDTRNVTIQWSILSEGLNRANRGPHSRGTYFGYGARDISFHHNLIADNYRRNPLLNTRGQFDMINNVIYNSARYNGEFYTRFGDLSVNVVGNIAVVGPSSIKTDQLYLVDYFRDFPAKFAVYLKDNLDVHRPGNSGDERLVLEPDDWKYSQSTPVGPLSLPPASITGAAQAYRDVMSFAGATLPRRDAADVRVLNDAAQCRGAIIDDPEQVGGWPALTGGPAPTDSDGDGIPDQWERSHGLSPTDGADGRVIGKDGYSNLERYLNALAGDGVVTRVGAGVGRNPDVTCGFPISTAPPLPIVRLDAKPASVQPGDPVVLSWSGSDLQACTLLDTPEPARGSRSINPKASNVYQIRCTGEHGGDAIDSVVVDVIRD